MKFVIQENYRGEIKTTRNPRQLLEIIQLYMIQKIPFNVTYMSELDTMTQKIKNTVSR